MHRCQTRVMPGRVGTSLAPKKRQRKPGKALKPSPEDPVKPWMDSGVVTLATSRLLTSYAAVRHHASHLFMGQVVSSRHDRQLGQLPVASTFNASTRTLAKLKIALYGNPTNV